MPLFRKKQIPELWQIRGFACQALGDQSQWEATENGGRAEFKPSHYAPRYRDQKATSQINEALAWAEPLPGTDGWEGNVL